MICFRDMTFCNAVCANTSCNRNYELVKHKNTDDMPVSMAQFKDSCKEYKSPVSAKIEWEEVE